MGDVGTFVTFLGKIFQIFVLSGMSMRIGDVVSYFHLCQL